jgi:aryl-alcohol dehydrogenase-like predicted oxidoreductase
MERRILCDTGISISEFALGAMMFGPWGTADHDECVRIIHRAFDADINTVDTADLYAHGESEVIVGKALKGRRDAIIVATKFGNPMSADPNSSGGSRRWITQAVEDSLRRLDTDWIDLYQMHRPDRATDIDETLSTLSDLVRAGKIRAIGTSNFEPDQLVEAQWCADRRGHIRPRSEQPPYSILSRGAEATTLPIAQRYGMGVITWGPLSSGLLSGKDPSQSRRATTIEPGRFDPSDPANATKNEAITALRALADDIGMPLPHIALAFVRAHPAVTAALIGPRTMGQLDDLLAAADTTLDDDILDRIDQIVPPGTDLNPADNYSQTHPALTNPTLRRRPSSTR